MSVLENPALPAAIMSRLTCSRLVLPRTRRRVAELSEALHMSNFRRLPSLLLVNHNLQVAEDHTCCVGQCFYSQ